jgi:AcrR family transcriptional regulator
MPRVYQSDIRDERAQQTRNALLGACEQLLIELPFEQVTLPAVARRAGVTKPTAYSHFPDSDALMQAFIHYTRDRIGLAHEALSRIPPSQLSEAVRSNYARYEQHERLLMHVMDSPSYNRARLARKVDRPALALPLWSEKADDPLLRERLGPIYVLLGPVTWRWLRETWGLPAEEAARAAAWAMEVLVDALSAARDTPRSDGRTKPTKTKDRLPSKTATKKKETRK